MGTLGGEHRERIRSELPTSGANELVKGGENSYGRRKGRWQGSQGVGWGNFRGLQCRMNVRNATDNDDANTVVLTPLEVNI